MHCRDYAWKDKILNDHLSNNNKKIQPHRGVHVRTRAENIHVPLFSLSHGRFLIVKCILETCHKQKKYSLTIYLIVGCVLSKLSQGFYVFILCKLSLNIQMYWKTYKPIGIRAMHMRDKTVNCTKEAFAKNGRFGFLFRALILSLLMPFCLSYSSTIFHSLSSLGRIGLNLRISLFIFACIDSPACSKA